MKQNNAHIDLRDSSVKSNKDDPDLQGISVHHLADDFMDEVRIKFPDSAEQKKDDTKIHDIEDLIKLYVQLKMVEKKFGSDHDKMYYPLASIAGVLTGQGKYEEALNNYTKALTIVENKWGNDHEQVTMILCNMGDVYRMKREYDKAIDLFKRALAIQKEKLGQDHWKTARTLMSIANVLGTQGKNEEAMEKYQQGVMPMYEKEFGNDSVEMAGLLNNIGAILNNQGKYKDAMENFKRSLAINEKVCGKNHAETIRSRNNMEILKREMQTYKNQRVSMSRTR